MTEPTLCADCGETIVLNPNPHGPELWSDTDGLNYGCLQRAYNDWVGPGIEPYPPYPPHRPEIARSERVVWQLTATDADEIAGRTLTGDELERLGEAIGFSSIPEALSTILLDAITPPTKETP